MYLRKLIGGLAAASIAFGAIAADGDDAAFAAIDDLAVVAAAGSITVTGSPTFGGPAFVAFDDAGGDSLAPAQGLDLLSQSISQNPDDGQLTFRMELGDMPAGDVQPGALYNWNLGVTGAEPMRLFAWRNNPYDGTPGAWHFQVITFGEDGFLSSAIPGAFTGDAIEWYVDPAQIAAKPGATILAGDGPNTASQGGFGPLQLTNFVDYDTATWSAADSFVIGGGASVRIEGDGVEIDEKVRVRRGVFEFTADDLPAGTYTVTVTSKFADAIVEEVRTVTVA